MVNMWVRGLIIRFFYALLLLLGVGCSAASAQDSTSIPGPAGPTSDLPVATTWETDIPEPTDGPDCLGDGLHPIADSIAADFEFTSYSEVMTWFCNGAEFEDILTALMTESLTNWPAEDMLEMLAQGFSWDEIWQVTGLNE